MICTFYSYKGGVGRSMTMAGVAYLLAERGLRVLVIDFDLEAPGLERYYFERDEAKRVRTCQGLIDLILLYKRALTNPLEFEKASFRNWRSFVTDAVPNTAAGGLVDLMPAGQREPPGKLSEYARSVRNFDWQDFLENWRGAEFFEWLRAELTSASRGYDVVLVDSRTGVTEMGGVCAYQLADLAVMLCAANYQNVDGTYAVARDFRSDAVLALRGGRPLELLVVPARLENDNPDRDRFMEDFERTFGTEGLPKVLADAGLDYRSLALPYNSAYAVLEKLVGVTTTAADATTNLMDLGSSFSRLADALTLLASGGRWADQKAGVLARLGGDASSDSPLPVADPTKRGAGADLFLDYHVNDADFAAELSSRLERAGFSLSSGGPLTVAADWSEHHDRMLSYSQVLLVLMSDEGSSRNRETLIRRARETNKTIIPVYVGTSVPAQLLSSFGLSDVQLALLDSPDDDAGFERIFNSIRVALARRSAPTSESLSENPYPGARAFHEDDAPVFFGREMEIAEVTQEIRDHGLVVITGASGIGKSSLLLAGVIPELRKTLEGNWSIGYVDLAQAGMENYLLPGPELLDREPPAQRILIIDSVDSFADDGSEQRRNFRLETLRDFITREAEFRKIVICGRGTWSEEQHDLVVEAVVPARRGYCVIEPLTESALRSVITLPAQRQRHLFESGLVDRMLSDSQGSDGALPILQRALHSLWEGRRRGWLTNQAYEATGGLCGLVRAKTEEFLAPMGFEESRRVKLFFANLVTLDSSLAMTSERTDWSDLDTIEALGPDPVAMRDQLAALRLIVISPESSLTCELAIPDPSAYLRSEEIQAEFMLWRQRFRTYVYSWSSQRTLVHEPHLGEAELWYATRKTELNAAERAVIEASQANATEALRATEQDRLLKQAREMAKDAQTRLEEERRTTRSLEATGELREQVNSALSGLRESPNAGTLETATALIERLRNVGDYEAMGLLLESVSRHFPQEARNRRMYGQYLIESGKTSVAIDVLRSTLEYLNREAPEYQECFGLLGRANKQIFLEAVDKRSAGAKFALEHAIGSYEKAYLLNTKQVWHGVNLLALIDRAERMQLGVKSGFKREQLAEQIVNNIEVHRKDSMGPWDACALAEAHLGRRDWKRMEGALRKLIEDPHTEAFHLSAMISQFTETWDLENWDKRGRGLVDILRARLAALPGANVEHDVREVARLRSEAAPDERQLQAVLGEDGSQTFAWWQTGLLRARAVASVRRKRVGAIGTGFLLRATDLGLMSDELLFVTAFHVLNEFRAMGAAGPEDSEIVFEGMDSEHAYAVNEVIWSSPADQHDVSIVSLSRAPSGLEPLPVAKALPLADGKSAVYVMGYGGGRDLKISFRGNELIDHEGPPRGKPQIAGVSRVHYHASTDAGSSGSPVFNSNWELIAIHHRGASTGMPRLNGATGTYGANEGISIHSIAEAIRSGRSGDDLRGKRQTTARRSATDIGQFIGRVATPQGRGGTRGSPFAGVEFTSEREIVIVGSQLIEFSDEVPVDLRQVISNTILLAQLAAEKAASTSDNLATWHAKYFEVLTKVGWLVNNSQFQTRPVTDKDLSVHKAIIPVLTSLLGPAATTTSMLVTMLKSLEELDKDSPWINLFNRLSQHANGAKFQLCYVDTDAGGAVTFKVLSCVITAERKITQVLFFKFSSQRAEMHAQSSQLSTNREVLNAGESAIAAKVGSFVSDYIEVVSL